METIIMYICMGPYVFVFIIVITKQFVLNFSFCSSLLMHTFLEVAYFSKVMKKLKNKCTVQIASFH